jgi:antitoxin HicB
MKLELDFPVPGNPRRTKRLVPPAVESVAKAELYSALRDTRISKVQLERQPGIDEKGMRRLLDPHDSSKLPRIAKAVALPGKRLVISLESV